ncbi:MAG: hypothetical protein KJ767_01775 [Nanoarchaeota archaeon]|nr:hypothetical protein [Nanoarchaeota archaeon]
MSSIREIQTLDDLHDWLWKEFCSSYPKKEADRLRNVIDLSAEYFGVTGIKIVNGYNYNLNSSRILEFDAEKISKNTHLFFDTMVINNKRAIEFYSVSDGVVGRNFEELEVLRRISEDIGSTGFEHIYDSERPGLVNVVKRRLSVKKIFQRPFNETSYINDSKKAFRELERVDYAYAEYVNYQKERDENITRIADGLVTNINKGQ